MKSFATIALLAASALAVTGCDSGAAHSASSPISPSLPSTASPTVTPPSRWALSSETNPVSGVVTTVAMDDDSSYYIVVRTIGRKLECYINTPDFLETVSTMEGGASPVQFRFDDGKVQHQGWSVGSNNEDLFAPNCASFIASLRKAKSLAFEYKPADKVATTHIFNVAGFPEGFKLPR